MFGCLLNSGSMMSSCCLFFILVSLSTFSFLSQYHILTMILFIGAGVIISFVVSLLMYLIGIKPTSIDTITLPTKTTNYITKLGNLSCKNAPLMMPFLGNIISLLTINLFLPPSNVILHPSKKVISLSYVLTQLLQLNMFNFYRASH